MADLYQDFVFARLATGLDSAATSVGVDSTDQFPGNDTLAKGEFWLTLDSTLSHPPSFEIVKLTAVDTASKKITVARGQGGTAPVPHDPGTYLKGGLTAAMLRRLRAGRTGTALPPPDDATFDVGERFTLLPSGQQFAYLGGAWKPVNFLRAVSSAITAGLAVGGRAQLTIPLAAGYRLYSIEVTRKARIRLYATAAQQAADAARPFGTDPTGEHGLMLDYSITQPPLKRSLSPVVDGVSLEATPTSDIPMTVDNQHTAGPVTVNVSWLRTE